jgi:hypothetical protein
MKKEYDARWKIVQFEQKEDNVNGYYDLKTDNNVYSNHPTGGINQ